MKLSTLVAFACAAILGIAHPAAAQRGSSTPDAPAAPAAPAAQGGPAAQGQPAAPPAGVDLPPWRVRRQPIVRVGQPVTVNAGDSIEAVVAIWGDVLVNGHVSDDVVTVFGDLRLGPTAVVDGSVVVVGGNLDAGQAAAVRGDVVIVGGGERAPAAFAPRGDHVIVGSPALGNGFRTVAPWFTHGLLWGRVITPGVAWVWWVVFVFLLIYVSLTLAFPRAVTVSLETLARRPVSAFFVGMLTLLLVGPVSMLLAISVVGVVVIPFVWCALLAGWMVGKAAVMRWIGAGLVKEGDGDSPFIAVRSLLLGFAILTIAYLIPVIGLALWAIVGLLGLGAATSAALAAFKRERPAAPPKPAPEPFEGAPVAPAAATAPAEAPQALAMAAAEFEGPGPGDRGSMPPPVSPPPDTAGAAPFAPSAGAATTGASSGGAVPVDLRSMPRATFLDRLFAAALDALLVAVALRLMPVRLATDLDHFIFVLLVYHVAFWTWKGTTVGSIICSLRLVRTDGRPLTAADAVVRALSSLLSGFALGLGFFYIAVDSNTDRQAWHDRIAGTLVVRVPKDWPAL